MFLTCTEGAHERAAPDGERFLAVANPSFDRRLFPLANLVDAEHEARTISDFYEGPRLLINGDAREEGVKQEMELANVIHLASHYVVDEQSPMFSKLLLSKEPVAKIGEQEPDGVLEAREIYAMDLSRARLVVLSACQTGVERYYNGEGMIGMSRTFLAARVPLVVASLWAVDSRFAALLMEKFHLYRRMEGRSTIKALRRAQREMADDSRSQYHLPYYWAGFSLMGGYADF